MMQRILWTCVLPEHLISKYGLSFAACNFSFNLMNGGLFDKVYSTMGVNVKGKIDDDAFNDSRFELIYDNSRKKSGVLGKLSTFREQWTIYKKIPSEASVWFYNINILNAFLFILLKLFKRSVQLNVIVLDFTPVTKGFGQNSMYLKLINMAHGRICLANSSLFKQENSVTLPGVVPANDEELPFVEKPTFSFLLSGVLLPGISQLEMVLQTFAELPHCELHVTGTKGDEELLKMYSEKYENIHWHGQLPFKDYLELMHSITFQLSTRNPDMPENQCNFPSKIIEALLHNRAVLSTIHYPQLDGVNVVECLDKGSEALKACIDKLEKLSTNSLLSYANQGGKMKQMFSTSVWNFRMNEIENR